MKNSNFYTTCMLFEELSMEELRFLNGGAPDKSKSSFYYDAFYAVGRILGEVVHFIKESEVLTYDFWVEWGYDIL
ncbi:MAG: hypothetical protein LWW85_12810 [Marinilabiliales bacterium]|nr:hypothetical protein [Marinilabiliales bacterium]